jgi:hypothetical protein
MFKQYPILHLAPAIPLSVLNSRALNPEVGEIPPGIGRLGSGLETHPDVSNILIA